MILGSDGKTVSKEKEKFAKPDKKLNEKEKDKMLKVLNERIEQLNQKNKSFYGKLKLHLFYIII